MAEETETQKETEKEEKKETEEKTEESKTQSLTQEDINKLIEGVRKQEKDKLYGTITELKDQVTKLSSAQEKEKEEKEKVEQEANQKAEEERMKKLSAEDRLAEQLKNFEEKLQKEQEEREKIRAELVEERKQAELERFKHELLEQEKEGVLRELVTGDSKEEIESSLARAKQKYQDYFKAALDGAKGKSNREVNEELRGKLPSGAGPDLEALDEEGLKGLIPEVDYKASGRGEVSEEYKKKRDEILSRVESAYKKTAAR